MIIDFTKLYKLYEYGSIAIYSDENYYYRVDSSDERNIVITLMQDRPMELFD
jgi:hypothetical protein